MSHVREWFRDWKTRADAGALAKEYGPIPPGPWDDEPSKVQWVDDATGLDCLMVRNHIGTWCGYVGVPDGHPAYKQHYDKVNVNVHGGLTFSDLCDKDAPEDAGICHVPLPGRPAEVWWLGFDCAHGFDLVPSMLALQQSMGHPHTGDVYKDRAYVEQQVTQLAAQLAVLPYVTPEDDELYGEEAARIQQDRKAEDHD